MPDIVWPNNLWINIALFLASAGCIAYVGTKLTAIADRLADVTGLGEALMGAVFLGACTSLPGITASVTAAIDDRPVLSLSNAIGGIAVQTVFLVAGDFAYRRANLEHAAASVENMMQAALLIILMSLLMLGMVGPDVSFGPVHVLSPTLFIVYALGQREVYKARGEPTWKPTLTHETASDEPDEPQQAGATLHRLWTVFGIAAAVVIFAGWLLTRAAEHIADATGTSDSVAGSLGTAIATSLPELVTCVAAVRRGALTLAVGDIIGGNAFDTLFAAVADVFYTEGSLYHAATAREVWLVALSTVMTSILLLGLLRREEKGIGNIGFESFAVVLLYIIGVAGLIWGIR